MFVYLDECTVPVACHCPCHTHIFFVWYTLGPFPSGSENRFFRRLSKHFTKRTVGELKFLATQRRFEHVYELKRKPAVVTQGGKNK
jgi:hypothetical protein